MSVICMVLYDRLEIDHQSDTLRNKIYIYQLRPAGGVTGDLVTGSVMATHREKEKRKQMVQQIKYFLLFSLYRSVTIKMELKHILLIP